MKLRYIPYILLELFLGVIAFGIWRLLIGEAVSRLPQALLEFCRRPGIAGITADVSLRILAFWLYLMIWAVIRRAFRALWKQEEAIGPPRQTRKQKAPDPIQSVRAVVSGRRAKVKYPRERRPVNCYFLGFRLEDGRELWLAVSEKEYRRMSEGDQGELTFQGKSYRFFQRDGEGSYKAPM